EWWTPHRIARAARANRPLPCRSPPKPSGSDPQDRRPLARLPGGRDHEPNALQASRRKSLDHRARSGIARTARISPFDPASQGEQTICIDKAALRLGIFVGSVYKLI